MSSVRPSTPRELPPRAEARVADAAGRAVASLGGQQWSLVRGEAGGGDTGVPETAGTQ